MSQKSELVYEGDEQAKAMQAARDARDPAALLVAAGFTPEEVEQLKSSMQQVMDEELLNTPVASPIPQ